MRLPIRVGIVDDHPGVRNGIRNLLANARDIEVVGEGGNGEEAIQLVKQKNPDVLLLDVELPILRGDMVVQTLRDEKAPVKVLAISGYNDPAHVRGMLENGAAGYITKEEAPGLLVEAVHSIVQDEVKWISPIIAKKVPNIMLENVSLSGLEIDILRDILIGKRDRDIAHKHQLAISQLKQILLQLMEKFGVSSRRELIRAGECALSTSLVSC